MGQGGYLLLKNKTPYRWKRTHKHSYQMNSWDKSFPEYIEPNSYAHVYIEWTEGTKTKSDDAGEIDYTMEGCNAVFQVQARAKNGFQIKIWCRNFATDHINQNQKINLGWAHDNTLVFAVAGSQGQFSSFGSKQKANKWMLHIDNNKRLFDLTIPGTHDTCTYDMSLVNYGYLINLINIIPSFDPISIIIKSLASVGGSIVVNRIVAFTKCQTMNLKKQLDSGIRFLDIRLKLENNTLQAYHGPIKIPMTFSQIMDTCYEFLRENSSETIVVSIKNEGEATNPIDVLVKKEIDAHSSKWYTGTAIPRLGTGDQSTDCRGKAVLVRRYATNSKIGIDVESIWPDNTQRSNLRNADNELFAIQDEYSDYNLRELDHKFLKHVKPYLKETANTQYFNFTSGMGYKGGLVFPKTLAKGEESFSSFQGTNQLLFKHLFDKMNAGYGIIPMDFPEYPNESLIPLLLSTNRF